MTKFTRLRLNDLYKEHVHQFADLQKLVETFAGKSSKYTTQEVVRDIQNRYVIPVGANNIPLVDGFEYRQPIELSHFLFKVGFLSARREQALNPDLAEFVPYEQRSELMTDYRNLDDGMTWEIYPSYRILLGGKADA